MKALCIVFSIILLLHFMASTLTFQWISIYRITTIIYSFYNCFWILVRFNFWYFLSIKRPAYEINIQFSSQIYIVNLELGGLKQPKIFCVATRANKPYWLVGFHRGQDCFQFCRSILSIRAINNIHRKGQELLSNPGWDFQDGEKHIKQSPCAEKESKRVENIASRKR